MYNYSLWKFRLYRWLSQRCYEEGDSDLSDRQLQALKISLNIDVNEFSSMDCVFGINSDIVFFHNKSLSSEEVEAINVNVFILIRLPCQVSDGVGRTEHPSFGLFPSTVCIGLSTSRQLVYLSLWVY